MANGLVCGASKEHAFEAVTAKNCRLYIGAAKDKAMISGFEIYKAGKLKTIKRKSGLKSL